MHLAHRIHLYSRLSLYLRSGIPIRGALNLIRGSAKGKSELHILERIEVAVLEGMSLERALSAFPKTFLPFETHLIGVGERSGSLPQNLAYLASLLARRRTLSRKLRSALIYPLLIVLSTLAITSFLFLCTFPKILPIFDGLNTPLPLTTRMLIAASNVVSEHGVLLLLVFVALCGCVLWAIRRPKVIRHIEYATLRSPAIGALVRNYNLCLISRTLSTLLSSGISLVVALEHVGNGIRNSRYREALREIGHRINEGQRLSVAFGGHPTLFPHSFIELVAAGEATGMLSASLATSAEACEEELDEGARILTSLVEPGLMVLMGLLVGFIAMAIITPIYSVTQSMTFR